MFASIVKHVIQFTMAKVFALMEVLGLPPGNG